MPRDISPEEVRAKYFLSSLAGRLSPRLGRVRPLSLVRQGIDETSTGGFRVVLARSSKLRVELWFDMYARYPKRHLWYGYYWSGKMQFDESFSHWREYVKSECRRWDSDATESKPYHFKRKLRASEFGRPFLEQYRSSGEYFFGCFDLRTKPNRALVDDIVYFLSHTITPKQTIDVENIFPRKAKAIQREEEQRLVKALKYARAHDVATERKQQDNYICQICRFNFFTFYPGLGSNFAEAHHKVPLNRAKGAKVKVTPNSFVTLCANCHRMVHRAEALFRDDDPVDKVSRAFKRGSR
jgi:HNH endonuclease